MNDLSRGQGKPMGMTIGRLAKAAGVNVETVRDYQRRGLLLEPRKPPGGHRRYTDDVLRQIHFIRRAQLLGFTLDEIGQLLEGGDKLSVKTVCQIAERRHAVIRSRVTELERMSRALSKLIAACKRRRASAPLMEWLFEGAPRPKAGDGAATSRGARGST